SYLLLWHPSGAQFHFLSTEATALIAFSIPAALTSRCVTPRNIVGFISPLKRTPCGISRSKNSARGIPVAAISKITILASPAPTGQPSPFEKSIQHESKYLQSSFALTPEATTALNSRAPSRCSSNPCFRAHFATASIAASGHTRPPLRLCVFSTQTSRDRGKW